LSSSTNKANAVKTRIILGSGRKELINKAIEILRKEPFLSSKDLAKKLGCCVDISQWTFTIARRRLKNEGLRRMYLVPGEMSKESENV